VSKLTIFDYCVLLNQRRQHLCLGCKRFIS